jgi:hypothetical protein
MSIEFERTVRGIEVTIIAQEFEEDHSVGLNLGPNILYATTEDGKDFELTELELEKYGREATEIFIGRLEDLAEG